MQISMTVMIQDFKYIYLIIILLYIYMLIIDIMNNISNNFDFIKNDKFIFLINNSSYSNIFYYKYDIIENIILTTKEILQLENIYVKAKKYLNILNNFVKKYKKTKYVTYNANVDLYFNNLTLFKKNQLITIIQNKTIYTFRLANLLLMWKESLFNCNDLFPTPLNLKNPYTNVVFKKNVLYHIYISLLNTNFIIPEIITLFVKSGLNIEKLKENNFPILKDNSIQHFVKNGSSLEKFEQLNNMFYYFSKDISNVHISENLNIRDKLYVVSKLHIVLKNYLFSRFSCNPYKKSANIDITKSYLKNLLKNNKMFISLYFTKPETINTIFSNNRRRPRRNIYIPSTIIPPPPPSTPLPILNRQIRNNIYSSNILNTNNIVTNIYNRTDSIINPFVPTNEISR